MGEFVAGLGVDLQLGRMIGLGAQFGCLAEVSGCLFAPCVIASIYLV
jgi:hypothetical protein